LQRDSELKSLFPTKYFALTFHLFFTPHILPHLDRLHPILNSSYHHSELALAFIAAMEVTASRIDDQWKEAFPDVVRPRLYTSDTEDENGFLPINDSESFLEDITTMNTQQLHATSSNNQIALKEAQDEYLEIESIIRRLAGKDSKKNPQAPQSSREFEGRHEAFLYGYKYLDNNPVTRNTNLEDVTEVERRDGQHYQEPFSQGGFIPTPKQYATKLAKATNKRNPDGWKAVEKDGKLLIPKVQERHEEYPRHTPWTQEDIDAARAGSVDAENLVHGASNKLIDKRLTRTRYDGSKVPITRDVSEDPSRATSPRTGRAQTPNGLGKRQMTPQTAPEDGSPVPRKRHRFDYNNTRIAQSTGNTPAPNQPRSRARAGQASVPNAPLSPRSMRNWKWTNEGLLEAIQKDYLWLHPDPVKALVNKDKLLAAANPVRTWSMCNKWIDWHEKGLDKRPRNKDSAIKRIDPSTAPRLGLAVVLVEGIGPQGNTSRPASRGSNVSKDQSSGYRKQGASDSRKNSNADSGPGSNAGSRKSSAAGVDAGKEDLLKGSGKGSRKTSPFSSRKNSMASKEGSKEAIPRTPSAASIKPPSSARSTRGNKRKYADANEEEAEDETIQGMADRQLLHETVEKEEKDGDFILRTPQNEVAPGTPARRSMRGRSQAGGS
jgi:hypothetical protein